jgi:hypothetical protein
MIPDTHRPRFILANTITAIAPGAFAGLGNLTHLYVCLPMFYWYVSARCAGCSLVKSSGWGFMADYGSSLNENLIQSVSPALFAGLNALTEL